MVKGIKKRVVCLVDGFNLYHAIKALNKNHLKWLDLRKLASAFIRPSQETLSEVYFFTAYPTWLPDSFRRHRLYVDALKDAQVEVVLGRFKKKSGNCNNCNARWPNHEEKESDVNLAIKLIHLAHTNAFDKAIIVTADSDLCPAIDLVTSHFPNKEIAILVPPNRYHIARELRDNSRISTYKIKEMHLVRSRLPETLCPHEYKTLVPQKNVHITDPA